MKTASQTNVLVIMVAILGLGVMVASPAKAAIIVPVSAGNIQGIEGDVVSFNAAPVIFMLDVNNAGIASDGGTNGDFVYISLDLGAAATVTDMAITNRQDTITNFAVKALEVRVAADESIGGFDPLLASSYGVSVFGDANIGGTNAGSQVRSFDIVDSNKRYFLIKVSSKFVGPFSTNETNAQIGDISVTTVVPEPASLVLMGLGGLLMLKRNH